MEAERPIDDIGAVRVLDTPWGETVAIILPCRFQAYWCGKLYEDLGAGSNDVRIYTLTDPGEAGDGAQAMKFPHQYWSPLVRDLADISSRFDGRRVLLGVGNKQD